MTKPPETFAEACAKVAVEWERFIAAVLEAIKPIVIPCLNGLARLLRAAGGSK